MRVSDHLGGHAPGELYNAFVYAHAFAKTDGKWLLKPIPGTTPGVDGPNWLEGTVYSPFSPYAVGVWFNTRLKSDMGNSFVVNGSWKTETMLKAEVHDIPSLNKLAIPEHPTVRLLFFEILKRLQNRVNGSTTNTPLIG